MAGANYEIVVLSSSPPVQAPEQCAPSSPLDHYRSSPRRVNMQAPSLLALSPPVSPQKKTSGASSASSRKVPIPLEAIRGFATVGSLVRSEHFAQQLDDELSETRRAQSRNGSLEDAAEVTAVKKKPTKRAPAATTAVDGDAKPNPKPRARKPKAGSLVSAHDPELRLPPSKVSPFFQTEGAEAPIDATIGSADVAPKLNKAGNARKPRAKKEKTGDGSVEPKVKKARVTKPKAASKAVGKSKQDDACVESVHFRKDIETADPAAHEPATRPSRPNQDAEPAEASIWELPPSPQPKKKRAPKQHPPEPVLESLELEEAVSRRRNWTPPKDTAIPSPFTDSVGKENKVVEPDGNGPGFTHLVSNFAYAQSSSAKLTTNITNSSTTEVAAVTKRRRVELIDLPGNQSNSRHSSPEKGKAPKKKARTITDIATEQYQTRNVNEAPADVTSNFFQPKTTVTKVPLNDTTASNGDAPPKKPPRKRSTSNSDSEKGPGKAKAKKASNKAAKPKVIAEKLLSPGSALTRLGRQDILFGTSSQLALEESPTLVRQIQQAMKESEEDADRSLSHLLEPPPQWPNLSRVAGRRGLWGASSRDAQGGLLEQMEDVYIPEFDRTQEFPLLMDGGIDERDDAPDSFIDINDVVPAPAVIISSDLPTPPLAQSHESQSKPSAGAHIAERVIRDVVFDDIDNFDFQPPPSNQNAESQDSFVDIDEFLPVSARKSTLLPPKVRLPATASVYESPKKRRGRPPKAQSSTPAEVPVPEKNKAKARKKEKSVPVPPTTPPKASGRFIDIDEILDSDEEIMQALSPASPRTHKLPNPEPLPLFSISPSRAKTTAKPNVDASLVRIPAAHLEWQNIKKDVGARITAHIRALPPTCDPSRPSWHEKMLMYDPIVLEELTAHLSAQTRIRSYRRATKAQVKSWVKTTGGAEANGDEIMAVERELEAWMVREWCEKMSVCCVYAERGRGGARKGFY